MCEGWGGFAGAGSLQEQAKAGEQKGGKRERCNAPNHDNFSSPQLHC